MSQRHTWTTESPTRWRLTGTDYYVEAVAKGWMGRTTYEVRKRDAVRSLWWNTRVSHAKRFAEKLARGSPSP